MSTVENQVSQPATVTALPAKKPPVEARNGLLSFTDIESLQRLCVYLHASGMMPKQYNTPEKIGTGIQFAIQLGFADKWLLALRQIAVINGNPSMFGDLPLSLVRSSGLLVRFEEFLIDKNSKRICLQHGNLHEDFSGAVCIATRKEKDGTTFTDERVFTVEDAKKAGVWGQNVWKVYPKRMIQMRVRSMALKDLFGDVLNGIAIGEYDFNTTIEKAVDSTVVGTKSNSAAEAKLAALIEQEPTAVESEVLPAEQPKVEPAPQEAAAETEVTFDNFEEQQALPIN